jgi:multiple sugar transport system permease protein
LALFGPGHHHGRHFLGLPFDQHHLHFVSRNYDYTTGSFSGADPLELRHDFGSTTYNGVPETYFVHYAIPNTFIIVFVTVPLSTLIALLISVGLNSIKWFQKFLQTVFFLPYVTNAIAVGMVFSVLFDQRRHQLSLPHRYKWIYGATRWTAMIPLCIYIVWSSLPFKILIFLIGLTRHR